MRQTWTDVSPSASPRNGSGPVLGIDTCCSHGSLPHLDLDCERLEQAEKYVSVRVWVLMVRSDWDGFRCLLIVFPGLQKTTYNAGYTKLTGYTKLNDTSDG